MKIKLPYLLTCGLLILSVTTARLSADHADDVRNEIIPPGAVMRAPWFKYTGLQPFDSSSPTGNGYTPQQMRYAYGADQLNTTGQGQTIAIVDAYGSPTIQADLKTFCNAFNIPYPNFRIYYPQGPTSASAHWSGETTLDVEWAHAIAPGATIVLVVAKSATPNDLYHAVDYAVSLGATQVSMSWIQTESSDETTSDFHFKVPGVTFFAASGDNGSYNEEGVIGVNYPASSPYVVGVGGTTLGLDSAGNILSETGWSNSTGGTSLYEPAPSYQAGWSSGTARAVPDVAYDADGSTGPAMYQTGFGWGQAGGTSVATPQWAALCALANSLRSQPISSAPGVFYSLATANYPGYFHDIISGSNGVYSAGTGYDLVTGLGTPIANELVPALAGGFSSQVAAPVFFPPAGTYSSGSTQNVTIVSATPNVSIRYTTDGSTPTESSGTLYFGPVSISTAITLTAIAFKSGLTDSPVTSGNYTFLPQAAAPTFSLAGGTYTVGQLVTISTTSTGVSILYTTDGTTPSPGYGTIYDGTPVKIYNTTILQAIAYGNGFTESPVTGDAYTINLPTAAAPAFSPASGVYSNGPQVTVTSATSGVLFRYTIDGSTPTESNGMLYSGPVSIGSTTVLKAIAYETGVFSNSPVTGGLYTITSSPAVALNVIWDFTGSNREPCNSVASLIQGRDGNFYGTTEAGGYYDFGTVFKLTPAGVLTTLYSFIGGDGNYPAAGLVQGRDGNLYGTTEYGGKNSEGSVFMITPAGSLTSLVSFYGANGAYPFAGLIQGRDGNFYGTTYGGGSSNDGTVFKITPSGVLTTLVNFNGPNGSLPYAALVQANDGNFYGTTQLGGGSGSGSVFKMTSSGVLSTLVSFYGTNGAYPFAGLIQGSDGNFYGTTQYGGSASDGTVFKVTPAGVLTTLVSFDVANGAYPQAALVQGSDGNFYGTTSGLNGATAVNDGTVFKMTAAGVLTTLDSFDGANGVAPWASLIQGSDSNIYGTAQDGGIFNQGAIFQLILSPPVAAPTFSLPAGTYTSPQTVIIISTTGGASIAYTTDGSTPTEVGGTITHGMMLSNGGSVTISTTTTLSAIAYKTGMIDSAVTTGLYTINSLPQVATPSFSPGGGTYTSPQTVTITSTTSGASIAYTTDGSTPTESGGMVTHGTMLSNGGSVSISVTTTLNAMAYKANMTDSTVTSGTYTINPPYPVISSASTASGTIGAAFSYQIKASNSPTSYGATGLPTGLAVSSSTGLISGTPVLPGTYSITLSATNAFGTGNQVLTLKVALDWALVGAADFSVNGQPSSQPDLIWQNTVTGERMIWLMNGTTMSSIISLGTVTTDWDLVGAADFNQNGNADLIWQNTVTGQRAIWLMNGTLFVSGVTIGSVTTDWNIVGAADFSVNGKPSSQPDLIWQDTSGQCVIWIMNGTTYVSTVNLTPVTPDWGLVGAADFMQNGNPDLIWQNKVNGQRDIWLMNGTTQTSNVPLGTVTTNWNLVGAADFSVNGQPSSQPDLIWQDMTSRQCAIWLMNGTTQGSVVPFTISPMPVTAPSFSPVAGTFTSPQTVSITSPTIGASIAYTTDGTAPTESNGSVTHGALLSNGGSVTISTTTTLKAMAFRIGMTDSTVTSGLYTISLPQVAVPTFSPGAGTYTSTVSVAISTKTSGVSIRYTTDGSTPSETAGTLYSVPVSISATTTLKAIAYETGMTDSIVTSGLYTISPLQVAAPTFSPPAGTYANPQTVTITDATTGASIWYSLNGSVYAQYTAAISLLVGNSTLSAYAAVPSGSGYVYSTVTTGQYTITSNRTLTGSSGNGFHALALTAAQTGTFTATFDATPTVSPENAVVGLSKGVATAYTGLSCIARFNPSGQIDAYNGTAYQAASSISYAKNTAYHFRMVVNVTAHTYSVYVTPAGGTELTVGLNYAFRSTAVVSSLDTWNLEVDATPSGCSLTANNLNP